MVRGSQRLDGPSHGLDVVEDLARGDIRRIVAKTGGQLRLEQPAAADLEPFDLR
jgi:hypothetical protein